MTRFESIRTSGAGALWRRAVPAPLWTLPPVARPGNRDGGRLPLDAHWLAAAARDRQGLIVTRCELPTAAHALLLATSRLRDGLLWLVAASDGEREALLAAQHDLEVDLLVHAEHPARAAGFAAWAAAGRHALLTTPRELAEASHGPWPGASDEASAVFCPLLVLLDPHLELCAGPGATARLGHVRRLAKRLGRDQGGAPLLVLTAREPGAVEARELRRLLGLEGLVYLDGAAEHVLADSEPQPS